MRVGIVLIFIFQALATQGQEILKLNSLDTTICLNSYLSYYLDEEKSLDIESIASLSSGYFIPIKEGGLRLPKTEAQIWLKLNLQSQLAEKEEFIIEFIDPSLYVINLYRRQENGSFKTLISGTHTAQDSKAVRGNKNNFIIKLDPGREVSVYLKIHSTSNMTITAEIMGAQRALERNINERTFIGLFYGAMIILMIYNLLLFSTTKLRVFILNGFYTLFVALFTGAADGFTAQYLHFLVSWTSGYQDAYVAAGSNLMGLFFMRDFLRVSEWSRGFDKGLKWFAYGIIITLGFVALVYHQAVFLYLSYISILVLIVTFFFGILAVKRKLPQANYFLTAYVIFGIFILIFIFSILRIIPYGNLVKYSIHIGYLSCISILSYGLSVKIYRLYTALLQKEKEKKNIIALKNQELEERVNERTRYIQKKEVNLRSILENTDSAIWLIDNDYKLIEFNRVFLDDWKEAYQERLEIGKSILELMPVVSIRATWNERYKHVLEKNEKAVYQDNYNVGGIERHFEIHLYPISYGDEVTGVSGFSKDVTARVSSEKQLVAQNDMLTKVNKELDSFVYSASHDLKAPLASVLGLVGLIRKESDEASKEHYYDMMENSIVRLDQFIKDIIDYSRNSRIEVKPESVHIKKLVMNSFSDLKYISGTEDTVKNISIDENLVVKSDPIRLRIIVRNLLSNAFKYGQNQKTESRIEVSAEKKSKSLILTISDNGPGIPKSEEAKIFDMFYRLHESKSGTGLGLYIVKETVEKLNGEIEVISKPDEGARFQVTIPIE